jgi:PAS domain S-box-containing protein
MSQISSDARADQRNPVRTREAFARAGTMGRAIAEFDWSGTALGPISAWPQSLVTAVHICLNSRYPMFVWWGPARINLYNDAYRSVLGQRHPAALGRPAEDVWSDIWPIIGPQADAVLLRGESTWNDCVKLVMERNGYSEDTYFTWSYSPILDEQAQIGGLFCVCTEETQRVRVELERDRLMRELETERLRIIDAFRQSPAFIAVLRGPDHVFEFVNDRYAALVGRSDVLRKPVRDALPEVASQGFIDFLDGVYRTGKPFIGTDYRTMLQRQAGGDLEELYLDFVFQPLRDSDGRVEGILVHGVDMSERRRTEAALRESEMRLRAFIESNIIGILFGDVHGGIFDCNEELARIIGHPRADVLAGKVRWDQITPAADLPADERGVAEALARGSCTPYEKHYIRPDGTLVPVLVGYTLIGEPRDRTVAFVLDLSVQKQAERQLHDVSQRLKSHVENSPVAVVEFDTHLRITLWTEAAERLFGWTAEEICGKSMWELPWIHPDDRPSVEQVAEDLLAGNRGKLTHPNRNVRKDGSVIYCEWYNSALHDENDRLVSIFSLVLDVTERVQAEAALQSAKAAAEQANRAKDQFLAVLSHELRTPLTPVTATVAAMEADPDLPADLRDDVVMIRRNIELETRLIDDLLDLSRVTTGKLRLHPQPTSFHRLIEHVLQMVEAEIDEKHLDLTTDLQAPRDTVLVDAARLQQVLWNLVKNAVKFTPSGGRIHVRTVVPEPGEIRFEISDNGKGIRPDALPRIFEAFEQGDAKTTRQFGGLGLGLAIAKAVVDLHGGRISAHSDGPGRGASFSVTLRLVEGVASGGPVHAPRARRREESTTPLRLLLVEDHPDTARTLARLLTRMGYRVQTAGSARDATHLATRETFDVLLSDIGLPDASGYDLLRTLRAKYGLSAVGIAMSGFGMDEDIRRSREAGFDEHLVKPVDLATLDAAIRRVTSTRA